MALSLRGKLLTLILLPLALLLIMASVLVLQNMRQYKTVGQAELDLEVITSLSDVVGGLQRERGLSVLFLNYATSEDQLTELRQLNDQQISRLLELLPTSALESRVIDSAKLRLAELEQYREGVSTYNLLYTTVFANYTSLTSALLDTMSIAMHADFQGLSSLYGSLLTLEDAKEYLGRTRAQIATLYVLDMPVNELDLMELLDNKAAVSASLANRNLVLSSAATAALEEMRQGSSWSLILEAVNEIVSQASFGFFGKDGMEFFQTATMAIDQIHEIMTICMTEAQYTLNDLKQEIARVTLVVTSLIAASVLFIIVFSILILANIVSRLKEVSSGMQEISNGDADLTRLIKVAARDELGLLAQHFNNFSSMLRTMLSTVKVEIVNLETGMQRLASNTEETASGIQQITANINSLKNQALNQSASVTESSATIEQITKNIHQLYKQIEKQADGVSNSSASIEEMVANIHSVTASIERMGSYYQKLLSRSDTGKNAIAKVARQVKDVDTQSELLQEANSLIAGIAAQTNLLAMNAAIEAAHAGEAGQGFAVVADEIRKLAQNAATQSKTITANIKEMRRGIADSVSSSNESAQVFDEILEQIRLLSRLEEEIRYAMQEQSAGSVSILNALSGINNVTGEVRHSAQEMQEGSQAVLDEMRRLLQLSVELERGMVEMASGAEEIRRAAQDTNELSAEANQAVKALKTSTDRFIA